EFGAGATRLGAPPSANLAALTRAGRVHKLPRGPSGKSAMKPSRRPANPCAKRPGWSPAVLAGALIGRSHRSAVGLARLVEVVERSRAILGIPADWRGGAVSGPGTRASGNAVWRLLGG